MASYVCVTKCYFRDRVWTPGDPLESDTLPKRQEKNFKLAKTVAVSFEIPEHEVKTFAQLQKKMLEDQNKVLNARQKKAEALEAKANDRRNIKNSN